MTSDTIETQLALIRRDIEEIKKSLFGNGVDTGLVKQVDTLADAADRGRFALKSVLWLGGATVAFLTTIGQLRTVWQSFFGH